MKITRKHFIKSPFLAVCENYIPSMVDCLFLVLYKLPFIGGLKELKNIFKSFLDFEVRELPAVFLGIFLIITILVFYPVSVFVMLIIMYCKYATKRGIKRQKEIFSKYGDLHINIEKRRAGWDEL